MTRVAQLGYLGFEVADLTAWETFATQILGLVVARRRGDGAFSLRLDGHAQRIFVEPGRDDLAYIGWECASDADLEAIAARLSGSGLKVEPGDAALCDARQVARLCRFTDPSGIPCELFVGPALAAEPFRSPVVRSGFVADDQGLGHLVITADDKPRSTRFYTELLGLRLSDHIVTEFYGHKVDLTFFHANKRHHSLAFGEKQRKRMHHFMLEVRSMDDVGLAFDRALAGGVKIMQTLGRHPNDRMFSFYAKTPSGFQFELGWGGREVDDATWEPTTYDRISEWGHHPLGIFGGR
jgi:2,3-dihydroxybiphenyl 1,2-dioxygenase